ncbi:Kinesin light chain 3 [Rhizophlyctis rosea]|nr:Kinesin light chain 3 [Rhizophlyctis rosea]
MVLWETPSSGSTFSPLPQHQRIAVNPDWLKKVFSKTISSIGNVVMVSSPRDSPETLNRAWCVFELYLCASTQSTFRIALPPTQNAFMRRATAWDPNAFFDIIASIRTENSKATFQTDREAIHTAIRETIGFGALDQMVITLLFDQMERHIYSNIDEVTERGGEWSRAMWLKCLGDLHLKRGLYDQAEVAMLKCMEVWKGVEEAEEEDFLSCYCNFGRLRKRQGRVAEAEQIFRECYDRAGKALGKTHPDTLSYLRNLASSLLDQSKHVEADPFV